MKKRIRVRFLSVPAITLLAFAGTADADITRSVAPAADNTLYESALGDVSNGRGTAMFAGRNSQPSESIRRGLLRFDLAGTIPPGSTVTSAVLGLVNSAANSTPEIIRVHRALAAWGEGASLATGGQGSGAPAAPGDATWRFAFFDSTPWSTPGGAFAGAASAEAVVAGPGSYAWASPGLVADIQAWLDEPSSNLGWIVTGNEAAVSSAKRFSTREEVSAGLRPVLTVTFIPAPGAIVLIAAGACVPAARRRRPSIR